MIGWQGLRGGTNLDGASACKENTESGWCTQAFLASGYYYVNTPFVHLYQLARDRTDAVQNDLVFRISRWTRGGLKDNVPGSPGKLALRGMQ